MEDIFVARSDRETEFEKFKIIRNISEIMYIGRDMQDQRCIIYIYNKLSKVNK